MLANEVGTSILQVVVWVLFVGLCSFSLETLSKQLAAVPPLPQEPKQLLMVFFMRHLFRLRK